MTGTIIQLDESGAGWIRPSDGSRPYFFHLMTVHRKSDPVALGDPVEFDRAPDYRENFAVNIWRMRTPGRRPVERRTPDIDDEEPERSIGGEHTPRQDVDHDVGIDPSWNPPKSGPLTCTPAPGGGFIAARSLFARWRVRREQMIY